MFLFAKESVFTAHAQLLMSVLAIMVTSLIHTTYLPANPRANMAASMASAPRPMYAPATKATHLTRVRTFANQSVVKLALWALA